MGAWSASRAVDIVEVAYRAASSQADSWLAHVLASLEPMLDLGLGVLAYEYDTNRPTSSWVSTPLVRSGNPALGKGVLSSVANATPAIRERIYHCPPTVSALSAEIGASMSAHTATGTRARSLGVEDLFKLNAVDRSGRGTCFCAPSTRVIEQLGPNVGRWAELAAHLAAAGRLRRALAPRRLPEAVICEGRVVHAEGPARQHIAELHEAARGMDRARLRTPRADPEGLASWRALVSGRWSLVEEVERDGRRFLIAHVNAPSLADPRRLTAMQRLIAGHLARGDSDKVIGYALDLAEGTVSSHVHTILKKLGVRSRVAVVDRVSLLTGDSRQVEIGGQALAVIAAPKINAGVVDSLTQAERAVAKLAARGLSNSAIAKQRGRSSNTVANQLTSVFAKLAVSSKSELAVVLRGS